MRSNLYEFGKSILKGVVPRKSRAQVFARLRRVASFLYLGSKYQCNICEIKLARFQHAKNGNILCPKCGSTERARSIWHIYRSLLDTPPRKILHFSPNPSLQSKFKKEKIAHYLSSDFSNEFAADVRYDITAIPEKNEQFELIICMHVLEHIDQDKIAMKELHRVVTNHGKCIIQTPFKDGDTYEDSKIVTPSERLKYFGQEDHVRIYSLTGLRTRLLAAGLKTELFEFSDTHRYQYQLSKSPILIATKN